MVSGGGFQTPGRDPSEYRKRSAEAERVHPLDVPGHGDKAPLVADAIEPAFRLLSGSTVVTDLYLIRLTHSHTKKMTSTGGVLRSSVLEEGPRRRAGINTVPPSFATARIGGFMGVGAHRVGLLRLCRSRGSATSAAGEVWPSYANI